MYHGPLSLFIQDSGGLKPGETIGVCGQRSGNAIVAAHKRLKLDLAGGSSMSDPWEYDESLRLTLSPPGQHGFDDERLVAPATSLSQQAAGSEIDRSRPRRRQSSVDRPCAKVKEELIAPPYVWATDMRAVVHPLDRITRLGIISIQGEVICKRCDGSQTVDINLHASFLQLDSYFMSNKDAMHDRAPRNWTVPRLLDCTMCHQSDCVKPVINPRKRHINWLFLMLTRTLGLCTLEQLKYFCKHTHKHRTGAKDRVLYLTYVGLLKQLNPAGHYD
ncbi:unnamed protein product [Calypogeia fissa]